MKKLLCEIFGHKWLYNFPIRSMPNKCICERCKTKLNLNLRYLDWEEVDCFNANLGTDEEIIKRWHKS